MSIWWSFPKAVSHTIERINHVKGIVNRNELLAQSLDVAIDCAVVDVNVIGICRIYERVTTLEPHPDGSRVLAKSGTR